MTRRDGASATVWQAWLRARLVRADGARTVEARGARVAEPVRHAWRAHLAGVVAQRG